MVSSSFLFKTYWIGSSNLGISGETDLDLDLDFCGVRTNTTLQSLTSATEYSSDFEVADVEVPHSKTFLTQFAILLNGDLIGDAILNVLLVLRKYIFLFFSLFCKLAPYLASLITPLNIFILCCRALLGLLAFTPATNCETNVNKQEYFYTGILHTSMIFFKTSRKVERFECIE